jgi:hypothetical protein
MPSRLVIVLHVLVAGAVVLLAAFFVMLGLLAFIAGAGGSAGNVGRGVGILAVAIGLLLVLPAALVAAGMRRYASFRGDRHLRAGDLLVVITYLVLVVAVGAGSLPPLVHVPGLLAVVALVALLVTGPPDPLPPLPDESGGPPRRAG